MRENFQTLKKESEILVKYESYYTFKCSLTGKPPFTNTTVNNAHLSYFYRFALNIKNGDELRRTVYSTEYRLR